MNNIQQCERGIMLIELLLVIGIIILLSGVAYDSILKYRKIYSFQEVTSRIENTLRWARLAAMEQSVTMGICKSGNTIQIVNAGTKRSSICDGTVVRSVSVPPYFNLSVSAAAFDARGLGIFGGNVCVTSDSRYFKATIQTLRGYIRIEQGNGNSCPS